MDAQRSFFFDSHYSAVNGTKGAVQERRCRTGTGLRRRQMVESRQTRELPGCGGSRAQSSVAGGLQLQVDQKRTKTKITN